MSQPIKAKISQKFNLRSYLSQWLNQRKMSEPITISLTALIVGIGAGLGAVVFRRLISFFQMLSFEKLAGALDIIQPFHILVIPALGGLIFGPMIYKFAREAKGHGVPEVMEAVALRGGRIRPQVAVVKSLASALCIATGGSVGREGPIAQIGSALGSMVGQAFHLSDERIRNLVACGAAGGIAATFNAPIAGAIFALEVILGQFHATYFGAIVISAVTADVIAHFFEGDSRAFLIPEYTLVSPWELALYLLLGIIAAAAAVGFTRLLYLSEDVWDRLHFPEYLKPVLGGLVLGVIGLVTPKILGYPRVFGVGYETITEVLSTGLALKMILSLLLLKILATIVTLGSGGSGGVFAPSLFMGAMLGEAFGQISNHFFPGITAPPGAYALVGMGAFFSGAAHAPITAILILFEMTGNYSIILPLMLTIVISTLVAQVISPESIYTLKLTRRGIHLRQGKDIDIMQTITVGEAMTTDIDVVHLNLPLTELAVEFERTHHHGFPVLDENDKLAGIVTIRDMEQAMEAGSIDDKTVADIATTHTMLVAFEDDPMWSALKKLGLHDVGRLPVVSKNDEHNLIGIVRRKDIIQAYNLAIAKHSRYQYKTNVERLGKLIDSEFAHIKLPADAWVIGRQISEIALPKECLIMSVQRGRKLYIAHGHTTLQAGDQLTVFAQNDRVSAIKKRLTLAVEPDDDFEKHLT